MKVGVEAGGRLRLDVLNNFVGDAPVAALVAPERSQIGRQSFGRFLLIQSRFKLIESHSWRKREGETERQRDKERERDRETERQRDRETRRFLLFVSPSPCLSVSLSLFLSPFR